MPPAAKTPEDVILNIMKQYEIFDKKSKKVLSKKNGPWEEAIVDFQNAGFQELTPHNLYMKFQGSASRQKKYKKLREQYLRSSEKQNGEEEVMSGYNPSTSASQVVNNDSIPRNNETAVENFPDNISRGKNDGESLRQLKSDIKYSETIRKISEMSFQLIYTAPEQYPLWKKFIVQSNFTCVLTTICDISDRFRIDDVYESGEVCLFMLAVKVKTILDEVVVVKLSQALSEKTEYCFVVKFLLDLLKEVQPPNQFLTGYSSILTNSSCFAFNSMTIKTYNSICHKFLVGHDQNYLPKTRIKADIVTVLHFFKSRTKFEKISSKSVRDIFLNIIILLSNINQLQLFENLARNFLVLIMSESYSSLVLNILSELSNQLDTNNVRIVRSKYDTLERDDFICQKNLKFLNIEDMSVYSLYESTSEENTLDTYINSIYDTAEECIARSMVNKDPNPFYFPEIKDEVISLLCQYPIWTSLIFKLSSEDCSLFTECALDFKNDCSNLIDEGPQNVVEFLMNHVDVICSDKQRKLLNFNTNEMINREESIHPDSEHRVLNLAEDWKGLNDFEESKTGVAHEELDSQTSSSNSDLSSDEEFVPEHSKPKKVSNDNKIEEFALEKFVSIETNNNQNDKIQTKKNKNPSQKLARKKTSTYIGQDEDFRMRQNQQVDKNSKKKGKAKYLRSARHLAPRSIKGKTYIIEDSSIIDTITELLSFSYRKYKGFRRFLDSINTSNSNEFDFLKAIIEWAEKFKTSSMYSQRAMALYKLAEKRENTIFVNDTVTEFIIKLLFSKHSNVYSGFKTTECTDCGLEIAEVIDVIRLNSTTVHDLTKMKNCIEGYLINYNHHNHINCPMCLQYTSYSLGELIIIDLEEANLIITINFFPKYISFEGAKYVLAGEIAFKKHTNNNKSYIAYTSSPRNTWQEINGFSRPIMKVLNKESKINVAMVLYLRIDTQVHYN